MADIELAPQQFSETTVKNGLMAKFKEHVLNIINELEKVNTSLVLSEFHMDFNFSLNVSGINFGIVKAGIGATLNLSIDYSQPLQSLKTVVKAYDPNDAANTLDPVDMTVGDLVVKFFDLFPTGTVVKFLFKVGGEIGVGFQVVDVSVGLAFSLGGKFIKS